MQTSKNSQKKYLVISTMKDEGPYILEWLAYHRAIGFTDFLIYTNDCSDGTDDMFDLLQAKGVLQHRQNPYKKMNLKPQHAALRDFLFNPIDKIILQEWGEFSLLWEIR